MYVRSDQLLYFFLDLYSIGTWTVGSWKGICPTTLSYAYRTNIARELYCQTPSTQVVVLDLILQWKLTCTIIKLLQNHRIERHWVEINSCVNYPLKRALLHMEENSVIIDTKFCVSFMTLKLCQVGIRQHVQSWNSHELLVSKINDG